MAPPGGWLELGVGPWFVMRDLSMQALYRPTDAPEQLSLEVPAA